MSSVTRLHLLCQSMLNVSCQKQKQKSCSSFPVASLSESPMEFVGQPRLSGACNLLEVPGLSSLDVDSDEDEVVIRIRPKSSPLPRRKGSVSDEDSEIEPPLCGSRRVSFADAKGLNLVQVKEFDIWDVPKLPGFDSEGEGKEEEEYFLSPLTFSRPLSDEELIVKVQDQKVELERVELIPGTTVLKGVIRVLNISFSKSVYIRTSLDSWSTHFDLLAEYIPWSGDGVMDCFSFKLTLVPPFREQGARVDFCLRYETPVGTFWANNNNKNYVLFCQQRMKNKPPKENLNKKSCLKTVSQSFMCVENTSDTEVLSQENVSAVLSKHEEEVKTVTTKQISDDQSGTSDQDGQKIQTENRRESSRSRRKAARMARVRDYFAQRGGGGMQRDESPPDAKEAAQGQKKSAAQSLSEPLETCCKSPMDIPPDTSPANDNMSNSEREKSESTHLPDSATLSEGQSAINIPDNPLNSNDESAPAECQNINKSVTKCNSDTAAEPVDSNILAEISKSFVNQSNSLTFGTVVAPLYHQMFGRVGSESQSIGERGSPLTKYHSHVERTESSSADVGNNNVKTQKLNQEHTNTTANSRTTDEEQTCLSVTAVNDISDQTDEIIQSDQNQKCIDTSEVPQTLSEGDTDVQPHTVNTLHTDLLDEQIPAQGLHPHEDNPSAHHKVQTEAEDITTSLETLCLPLLSDDTDHQTSCGGEDNREDDAGKTLITSTTCASSEVVNPSEPLCDLNPNQTDHSFTKETANGNISCCETVEDRDFSTPVISVETIKVEEKNNPIKNICEDEIKHSGETEISDEGAESKTKAMRENYHTHDDACVEQKDEGDTLKDKQMISSEIKEHVKMEAAVLKQEDLSLLDTTEVKDWEMMVEEEEQNILTETDPEESNVASVEQLDDTGTKEELTAVGETGTEASDEEEGERVGEEKNHETVVGKDGGDVKKEVAEKTEAEKREEQEETELEKEKYSAEIKEVNIGRSDVQEEEETEEEGEMENILKDGDEATEVEENPNYKEKIQVDEAGDSETVEANSASRTIDELERFEERLDITQNKGEDGLSALVNSEQDRRVNDKERKEGNTDVPTEMCSYKEEDFQSSVSESYILTDEPESDQMSQDSASAESDSDDEVELYMHCLRAVHAGAPATKDRNKDASFNVTGKRPSISRSKLLPVPMPSITESLDEEQNLGCLQENHGDMDVTDFQPTVAAPSLSTEQGSISRNVSWWKETFSCRNISKTLLYTSLLVIFLVVAYHYDFLACFGLYLISVVWLFCQGEKQPVKNNNRVD